MGRGKSYSWIRVTFGLGPSPFLLRAGKIKLLSLYKDEQPELVAELENNLFVDDWLGGANTITHSFYDHESHWNL